MIKNPPLACTIGVLINYLRAVNVNVSEDSFPHASLNQLAIADDPNVNPRRKSLGKIISQLTNPSTPYSPTLSGQLSIWIFIAPKSDVYKNDAQLCLYSPPAFRFAVRCKLIEYRAKKPRLSHIVHCALMSFYRIVNRRAGDKSTHNYASFSYGKYPYT